jgi:hypothetical protein
MLEIGASGSLGGEGGNILVYPATWPVMPREKDAMGRRRGIVSIVADVNRWSPLNAKAE